MQIVAKRHFGQKKGMAVVFAKQGPSEADLYIQEAEIGKGAVLSDPGLVCKCNCHAQQELKTLVSVELGPKGKF